MVSWESSTTPNCRNSPIWGSPAGLQLFGSLQFGLLAPVQFRVGCEKADSVISPARPKAIRPVFVAFMSLGFKKARRTAANSEDFIMFWLLPGALTFYGD